MIPNIEYEDIQVICEIMKKLPQEDQNTLSYMLSQWSYAVGYANGMKDVIDIEKKVYVEKI